MKARSFYRLLFHLLLLTVLISFEATFGLPWLSIFFAQQIIIRSSVVSSWATIILVSLLLSTAFTNSFLLVFSFLVFLRLYQDIRSFWWWLFYFLVVLGTSFTSLSHYSVWILGQSVLSIIFLVFYTKGVIWWPKVWKNDEKIN